MPSFAPVSAPLKRVCATVISLALLSGCGGSDNPSISAPVASPPQAGAPQAAPGPTVVASSMSAVSAALADSEIARYEGKLDEYVIIRTGADVTVVKKGTPQSFTTPVTAKLLVFADVVVAPNPNGKEAVAYRLYQAAFNRAPDAAGLGFQIYALETLSLSVDTVARGFIASPEFATSYGSLTNVQFVNQLYQNVLHRPGEAAGVTFWVNLLDSGQLSRSQVLYGFSDSPENIANVAPAIANGVPYVPYVVTANGGGNGSALAAGVNGDKVYWGADTPIGVVLRDALGTPVTGVPLKCVSAEPLLLTVAADCSSASGKALGTRLVTVSGGGVSAVLTLRVIPQRQPLGVHGSNGISGGNNLVTDGVGGVLGWGYNTGGVLAQVADLGSSGLPLVGQDANGAPLRDLVAVSGGYNNALGLLESGQVLGWGGGNSAARTVQGSRLPSFIRNAANNGSLQNIVQVSVGDNNGVALSADGQVWTWGYYNGQGTTNLAKYPDHPKLPDGSGALRDIVQISAGHNSTLALAANGKVYGWGWNSSGQTGRGTTGDPERLPAEVLLADGTPLSNIVQISAGYHFALALAADGRVYAWGDNDYGQLGQDKEDGTYPRAVLVKDVSGTGSLGNIAMVSAGGNHALALDRNGKVYSWGISNSGVLGEGPNRNRTGQYRPGAVVGTDGTGQLGNVASIAAGYGHNLVLSTNGEVLIWGDGFGGNLGQGGINLPDLRVPTPVKNRAGTGTLSLPLARYPNLLGRGR